MDIDVCLFFFIFEDVVSDKFDAELIKEDLFIKVKPGLSSYSNAPDEVSVTIFRGPYYLAD